MLLRLSDLQLLWVRIKSSSIRKAPIKRVYEDYLASYAHIQKGTAADMRCLKSLPGIQTLVQTSRDIFVKDKCSSACSSPCKPVAAAVLAAAATTTRR